MRFCLNLMICPAIHASKNNIFTLCSSNRFVLRLHNCKISEIEINKVNVYRQVKVMKEKEGQERIKKSDNLRNTLLHPCRLWPGVRNFYARVYATEIHGLCWRAAAATVHATNRPTNAPAQKRARKRDGGKARGREGRTKERKRDGVRACACA